MNKKLIAAAVAAGLAAPLAAQAEVTVYGQLQAEIASVDLTGTVVDSDGVGYLGMAPDDSGIKVDDLKRGRLGVKTSQDLGNGLSAIAQFEWQVETTEAEVNDGTREAYVGLKGGFGQVQLGQVKSAYKYTGGVAYDAFVTTTLEARSSQGVNSGGMSGGAFGHNGFLTDTISYQGNFGNIGVWVTYGLDEGNNETTYGTEAADAGTMGDMTAAVKFKGGAFEAFVAHASQDSTDLAMNKIGGQFKMGPHTLSAQYEDGTNASDADQNFAFIGYQLAMGKNVVAVQLGMSEYDATPANDTDYLAVGVTHKLNKQSRVFAGYRNSETDDGREIEVITAGMRVDF